MMNHCANCLRFAIQKGLEGLAGESKALKVKEWFSFA